MNVNEAIKARRSIRKFKDQSLNKTDIDMILEAGTYAPSGGNSQSCHFIVIQDKEKIKEIIKVVTSEFAKLEVNEGMYRNYAAAIANSKEKGEKYDFTYNAPVFVLVANKKGYINAMADSALAAENMFLQATELGIGSCYINQVHWMTENPNVLEVLYSVGLEKDEYVCLSAVFGYSDIENLLPIVRFGNKATYGASENDY